MIFIIILIAALLAIANASDPILIPICDNCCKVCGQGKKVGLPDTLFFQPTGQVTGYSEYTCAQMEWEAFKTELQGSGFCDLLQYRAPLRCGCKAGAITEPAPKPTRAPTRKPTTRSPTHKPTTRLPTRMPTRAPTPMPTTGKKPKT